jgi:hypothetical protein
MFVLILLLLLLLLLLLPLLLDKAHALDRWRELDELIDCAVLTFLAGGREVGEKAISGNGAFTQSLYLQDLALYHHLLLLPHLLSGPTHGYLERSPPGDNQQLLYLTQSMKEEGMCDVDSAQEVPHHLNEHFCDSPDNLLTCFSRE